MTGNQEHRIRYVTHRLRTGIRVPNRATQNSTGVQYGKTSKIWVRNVPVPVTGPELPYPCSPFPFFLILSERHRAVLSRFCSETVRTIHRYRKSAQKRYWTAQNRNVSVPVTGVPGVPGVPGIPGTPRVPEPVRTGRLGAGYGASNVSGSRFSTVPKSSDRFRDSGGARPRNGALRLAKRRLVFRDRFPFR